MPYKISPFVLIAMCIGLLPSFSFAQVVQPAHAFRQCPIVYSLHLGARDTYTGGNVTALQGFLSQQGYFSYQPIGIYGPKTYRAVVQFQAAQGLPQTGTVGPRTKAVINRILNCLPPPTSSVYLQSVAPPNASIGQSVTLYGSGFIGSNTILLDGLVVSSGVSPSGTALSFTVPSSIGPNCKPYMMCPQFVRMLTSGTYQLSVENENGTSNQIPFTVENVSSGQSITITGLDAPTQLLIGKTGTWTVHVANQGQSLQYSVQWGDQLQMGMYSPSSALPAYQSSATFTHVYTQQGTYIPVFTVTDPTTGHQASASATVSVIQAQPIPY